MEESDGSKVALLLESIPTRRFRRNIVRSQLDLVGKIAFLVNLILIMIFCFNICTAKEITFFSEMAEGFLSFTGDNFIH